MLDKTRTIQSLTATQKWCIFILYASNDELNSLIQEIAQSEEGIMCAVTVLKEISKDELEWKRQTDELMIENDRISFLAYAEEEGLKRGMERGMKLGMEQGIQNVAKKMIENNIPLDVIKSSTGLSDEELAALS